MPKDYDCPDLGLPPTEVRCPDCSQGTLELARGRFGAIYKCTHKGCGYWLDSRPIGGKCTHLRDGKKCGALMVQGTKTIPDRCSDRSCPNRHPHKLAKQSPK